MVEPLRHRQTKGAETDMLDLTPPRHVSTLPTPAGSFAQIPAIPEPRAQLVGQIDPKHFPQTYGHRISVKTIVDAGIGALTVRSRSHFASDMARTALGRRGPRYEAQGVSGTPLRASFF